MTFVTYHMTDEAEILILYLMGDVTIFGRVSKVSQKLFFGKVIY